MGVALAYAAIYLIWGSTFLAIRIAVESIPPLLMMGVRCVAAGSLLLLWALMRGDRPPARAWGHATVAGALMFACAYGALAWAEQRIPSGVAALIVATLPLWMTTIEWAHRGGRPSARVLAGVAIGFAGVALLVVRGAGAPLALLPVAVVVGGEGAWAAGSLYARPPRLPQSVALNAGMPLLTGGSLLIAAAWLGREFRTFTIADVSAASVAALGYLVVFGSIVAFSAYAWLMQESAPWRVSTHAYVNPLIAVALGASLAGEPFTIALVASALVITASVALILADRTPAAAENRAGAARVHDTPAPGENEAWPGASVITASSGLAMARRTTAGRPPRRR
jgi:drug/metabolite transporter (DMT)-like permease